MSDGETLSDSVIGWGLSFSGSQKVKTRGNNDRLMWQEVARMVLLDGCRMAVEHALPRAARAAALIECGGRQTRGAGA